MRIIADQLDYYDCIQAMGQDRSLVYFRAPETVEFWRSPFGFYLHNFDTVVGHSQCKATTHVIGFCGKIYPVFEIKSPEGSAGSAFCFELADADAFMEKRLTPSQYEAYLAMRWRHSMSIRFRQVIGRSVLRRFFEGCKEEQGRHRELFERKRCPVLVVTPGSPGRIVYNSLLRPYEFYRVIEPYTAFQEIAMFLANIAQPEKKMPVIPDDLKAESKGFNKWSFRRPPGG